MVQSVTSLSLLEDSSSTLDFAAVLSSLSLEEKASIVAGVDDWNLQGVPRLGIPSVRVTDCGHGVSLCGDETSPATCLPTGIGMASTWNVPLLERAGKLLGRETRALGCSILLGPKLNLHRHPLNGRSFETFSEDPWLAGLLGAAIIRGIQSEGVGACAKAVAANNQQRHQERISAEVDERTLHEIYLRGFQLAVELGKPCAIMTAYNRLNGEYCSESRWLIKQIVKESWRFPGFVVSDWRAVHGPEAYSSGLDLEMPGPGKIFNRKAVLRAIEEGLMSEPELDDKVERILNALLRWGKAQAGNCGELDTPEHRRIALEIAEESIVLLKNEDSFLPLDKTTLRKILVVGPNSADARLGGGGSAAVTPFYSISPLMGIREYCGDQVQVDYIEGCSLVGAMETIADHFSHEDCDGCLKSGLKAEFFNAPNPTGDPSASWAVRQVDFSWGWAVPGPNVTKSFSVRFSGWLTPPRTGKYRLGVYAQEGCVDFRIDGEQILAEWDDDRTENFEAKYQTHYFVAEREFTEGVPVRIELAYAKRAARAGLRLEWEAPGAKNPIERVVEAAREADAVILCAGLSNLFEGGANDRENIDLPENQQALIERVTEVNRRTAVVLFNGGPLAMPWENRVPAILEAWYPGQEGGRALARILFGSVNPSGRLPDTLAHRLEDHRSIRCYPGNESVVRYEEGMAIGYRHFDLEGIEPHYPFGFGLSYTTFEIDPPTTDRGSISPGSQVIVRARIRNTGHRIGKEVVQLYIRHMNSRLPRPVKELRGFQKLELAPGEEAEATFAVGARELESFDPASSSWKVEPGRYEILVGPHSRSVQGVILEVS